MARRRKARRRSAKSKMRPGTCRRLKSGVKICKLKNGKVRFRKG